jgi:hypothetical protein
MAEPLFDVSSYVPPFLWETYTPHRNALPHGQLPFQLWAHGPVLPHHGNHRDAIDQALKASEDA